LVLAHGVDLNISLAIANERRALPGYNIFDVVILESSENDDVTTEKRLVGPADGVNVDAIVDASVHAFRVDGSNNCVINASSSTIPAGLEVFLCKGSWDYFITVRIVG
jgi:hypothetical protein